MSNVLKSGSIGIKLPSILEENPIFYVHILFIRQLKTRTLFRIS